jgi:cell surface protein SprA
MRIFMIRMRSVWWSISLLALGFFYQIPVEASHFLASADFETSQTFTGEDSTQTGTQLPSGKLSRRAKAEQRRVSIRTQDVVTLDTLKTSLEAIRALPRDSSARIAQFKYIRKDKPAVDGSYHKSYPLFLSAPPIVKHQTVLDSSKWVYRLYQTVDDYDTHIPIEVPFEEYTSLRLKQAIRQNWESIVQPYSLAGEKKTTLGDLMGSITKIEIPVPKNPIFSIFGKNIIRMDINGSIDIRAGFRHTKSDLYTSSPFGQSQTSPDFKQEIQVGVKGEIGDKLKIDADWNTQRTFEYENQLHVKYQGYEDEIVQSVEAGNVSLPTKSSFISGGQALFGIKAQFQMGPLHLTTVATQKKGQIKEMSVSGGGEVATFNIRPTAYSENHYFIDSSYIGLYEKIYSKIPAEPVEAMRVREIEVWVTSRGVIDPLRERNVVAFIDTGEVRKRQNDPDARRRDYDTAPDGTRESNRFIKLEQNVDYNFDEYAGIISLRTSLQPDQAIAVAYITTDTMGNSGQTVKDPNDDTKLIMKLVRPSGLDPGMRAWKLMLKNRYYLTVSGIDKNSFDFHIEYKVSGLNAVEEVLPKNVGLMNLLGLDRYSGDNVKTPDKVFDYIRGVTIDEARGEIIFPTVEPFRDSTIFKFFKDNDIFSDDSQAWDAADSLAFNAIYDTSAYGAMNDPHNRYYMRGSVKGGSQSKYRLGFNVVEGSVEVISGGQRLTPGVDYSVDYISGYVDIRNQMYLVPGRDLVIKYEANDLFQLASKSLLGARGEFDLGKNTSLGFTIMNYSQQSLSDKVRLGEEPISNLIMGLDGGTTLDAPWLTNALNIIPGIKSTAASQISFRGEVAYMLPNPNTRTSSISSDGSKGVAYIDDFEGARQIIPLGVSYSMWKQASAPWFIPNIDEGFNPAMSADGRSVPTSDTLITGGYIKSDVAKMEYKAHASWFNVIPTDVYITTIWGKRRSYAEGEGQITALDFNFQPAVRGAFNYSMKLDSTIGLDSTSGDSHTKAWAGIQHVLGSTSTNLAEQNVAFIELWINIVNPKTQDSTTKLNIDLGYVSEDVIPNRRMNTEDGLDVPNHIPRGILNPEYDWGIDTLNDAMERERYKDFIDHYSDTSQHKHPEYGNDPSGDNWVRPPLGNIVEGYDKVNGTEGNYQSEDGLLPDGEDLNRNNNLDRLNSYFEYEIPLDTGHIAFKKLIIGNGDNNWYQIRVPLADYNRRIGEPSLTKVEGVRLWISGAKEQTLFRIVDFNLVGNQWEKRVRSDSLYEVGVVNIEDNPSYRPPPGVTQQKDLARPTQNLYGNEQSLSIIVKNLSNGQSKEAVKYFTSYPIDMFNYRTLKMFVHGQTTGEEFDKHYHAFEFEDLNKYDAEMFIHFGDDTSNYYEYRSPVHPDWQGNDVVIKFAELTAIKATKDSLEVPVVGGPPGATYRVRGNPRLDKILFISVGIENPSDKESVDPSDTVLNGELWVNELRLTDVDDTPGWAYKFDSNIKLADFGSVAFSFSERDPFFHGLEDRFGSRSTNRAWNISTSLSLDRFLPESWSGTVLNVSYSHSESMSIPRYIPGQDVLVEEAAARIESLPNSERTEYSNADDVRLKSESLNITDSYSLPNLKFNIPAKTWLVTETINKMSFGYNYTESKMRNPSTEYSKSWSWNANFHYGTDFSQKNYLTLAGSKIYYTPRQINFNASLSRNQTRSKARAQTAENPIAHNLAAQRSMDFSWQFYEGKSFEFGMAYNVVISSSLYHLDADANNNSRPFSSILGDIFFSDRLINFGIDQSYGQTISFNTKVSTPKVLKLDKIFTPSQPRYSASYRWANNIQAGPLGYSAGWNTSPGYSLDIDLRPITDAVWSPTAAQAPVDTGKGKSSSNPLKQLDRLTRILFKTPFFDFEKISISFTQSNSAQSNGVRGSTGFPNLFARVPFFQSSLPENGPSLLYQLGFSSDPNGYVVLKTKGSFPFITGYTVPGIRAPDATINDVYSQSNQVSLRTSRKLWEGANLQLDWKVGWSYNETKNGTTDSYGRVIPGSKSVSGRIDRSYISLPPTFIFKLFNTSMENVNKRYEELKQQDPTNLQTPAAKLSRAFEEGLEAFPWLTKILGSLAPRANWSIRWEGLENFSLFKSFATSVSVEHAYTSTYVQGWRMNQQGEREIQSQTVSYGFSPLIGVNITFKELMKGSLNANFQYKTTTNYDLVPTSQNASEGSTSGFSITGTYSRKGFEIPLFGLSLMNNIDISFNYTYSHESRVLYYFANFEKEGVPQLGSSRTTMEPGISYTLSERVSAKLYYRYIRFKPDEGGSNIPGSTTTEGGINVHVTIQ